jgi:hypothetical protein
MCIVVLTIWDTTYIAEIHLLSGICPCISCGCLYHPGWMYTAQCLCVYVWWLVLLHKTWVVLNLPFIHFGSQYDWNSFKSLINFCVKDSKSHVSLMVIKCCRMLVCNIWQQWSVDKWWIMTTWNTLVNFLLQFNLCSGLMWYSLIWPCHLLIFLA